MNCKVTRGFKRPQKLEDGGPHGDNDSRKEGLFAEKYGKEILGVGAWS